LRDGRVGRVQKLVSEVEGVAGERVVGGSTANLGRNGEGGGTTVGGGRMLGGRVERDIRDEDEYLYDERRRQPVDGGLFAALEEADRRYGESEVVASCPVCHVFKGDEGAVARHVEGHFE
jgi:hypothetical protein